MTLSTIKYRTEDWQKVYVKKKEMNGMKSQKTECESGKVFGVIIGGVLRATFFFPPKIQALNKYKILGVTEGKRTTGSQKVNIGTETPGLVLRDKLTSAHLRFMGLES